MALAKQENDAMKTAALARRLLKASDAPSHRRRPLAARGRGRGGRPGGRDSGRGRGRGTDIPPVDGPAGRARRVLGRSHPVGSEEEVSSTTSADTSADMASYMDVLQQARLATSRGNTGKGGGGRGRGIPQRARRLPDTDIPQTEAKQYIPPTASIWRGMTNGSWNGHLPGHTRVSALWARHGEQGAMRDVIRRLWTQWCEARASGTVRARLAACFDHRLCLIHLKTYSDCT